MAKDLKTSLPNEFVRNAISLCVSRGKQWIENIPEIIAALETKWSIKAGPHFRRLSYNYVAAATTEDGNAAVLKLALPLKDAEIYSEAAYLKEIAGEGAVKLLELDRELQAVLVERCVPGAQLRAVCRSVPSKAVPIAIKMLESIRRAKPEQNEDFIELDDWFDGLRRAEGSAFPRHHAVKALEFYNELSRDTKNIGLLHGDFHHENILSATREKFLVIDPKGIIGHIGYDIAVFLNNYIYWLDRDTRLESLAHEAVARFAEAFELDREVVRKWAYCQLILSWWWMSDEMPDLFEEDYAFSETWKV